MQVTRILAAAVLSLAAAGAMAQEIDRSSPTQSAFTSQRTRAAVEAEAQNARAEGPGHWASGGELSEAMPAVAVQGQTPTRQQVKAEVAAARAAHQLPRYGEI